MGLQAHFTADKGCSIVVGRRKRILSDRESPRYRRLYMKGFGRKASRSSRNSPSCLRQEGFDPGLRTSWSQSGQGTVPTAAVTSTAGPGNVNPTLTGRQPHRAALPARGRPLRGLRERPRYQASSPSDSAEIPRKRPRRSSRKEKGAAAEGQPFRGASEEETARHPGFYASMRPCFRR